MPDPLDPFDDDLVTTVADEFGLAVDDLHGLLHRHQRTARENPGVDDLVYEWRRYFPYDPLVTRTAEAYYCVLRPGVWAQYEAYLGADLAAVRAVHDRQVRRVAGETDVDREGEAMILTR